jgi:hypothetical protein
VKRDLDERRISEVGTWEVATVLSSKKRTTRPGQLARGQAQRTMGEQAEGDRGSSRLGEV